MRPAQIAAVVVLALTASTGCEIPEFQGPQIQTPPPAFNLNADTYLERRMFPELDVTHHDAWVEASWGNFSGIYINGHAGTLSRAHAESARDDAIRAAAGKRIEFGEIEELTIDERTAWGWTEWWRMENGGLQYVAYRALIPYDTVSYAVEFLAGDPGLKIRPDSLRTIVASFAVGETEWNMPLLMVMAGVLLLVGGAARKRQAEKAARARSIRLVQIPKKEDGKGDGEAAPPASPPGDPAPPSGPAAGGGSIADAINQKLGDKKPPNG